MSKNSIKVVLHDNTFAKRNNDFVARVRIDRSLSVKEICKSAIQRDGVDIAVSDMEYLVNIWFEEMANCLCDSYSVNTGWFTVLPKIKGVFSGIEEAFNPEKHKLLFDFTQGAELKNFAETASVEIIGMADVMAKITQVTDIHTGSVDGVITPERNLRIKGCKLKLKGDSPDNGVYFVNQNTLERTKVAENEVIFNKPSELIIIIPYLTGGNYKLQFSSQYTGSVLLKRPRTIEYEKTLIVI